MDAIPSIHSATGLRVRFVDGNGGHLRALEMEMPRDQEILGDVHAELRALGVEVTNIEVRASANRVMQRIHICEMNGLPVSRERHRAIQDRIFRVFQSRLIRTLSGPATTLRAAVL